MEGSHSVVSPRGVAAAQGTTEGPGSEGLAVQPPVWPWDAGTAEGSPGAWLAGPFTFWFCFCPLLQLKLPPPTGSQDVFPSCDPRAEVTETQKATRSLRLAGWWPVSPGSAPPGVWERVEGQAPGPPPPRVWGGRAFGAGPAGPAGVPGRGGEIQKLGSVGETARPFGELYCALTVLCARPCARGGGGVSDPAELALALWAGVGGASGPSALPGEGTQRTSVSGLQGRGAINKWQVKPWTHVESEVPETSGADAQGPELWVLARQRGVGRSPGGG